MTNKEIAEKILEDDGCDAVLCKDCPFNLHIFGGTVCGDTSLKQVKAYLEKLKLTDVCPVCGEPLVNGLWDYGVGYCMQECKLCPKCDYVRVDTPPTGVTQNENT